MLLIHNIVGRAIEISDVVTRSHKGCILVCRSQPNMLRISCLISGATEDHRKTGPVKVINGNLCCHQTGNVSGEVNCGFETDGISYCQHSNEYY